jgi:ligand-binding sensor domain-containing protein
LWIACKNDHLYTYSYDDNKFEQIVVSGKGIDVSNIRTIYEDSRGRIWFGALHGLFYYLPEKQLTMPVDLQKSSGLYVNSIVEDRNQNIWVGTGFGLFKLDKTLNVLKHYTPETHPDALQENWINNLIIDREHYCPVINKRFSIDYHRL